MSSRARVIVVVGLVALGALALAVEPWQGPVILVFSSNQGFDAGDMPAVLLFTAAGLTAAELPSVRALARRSRRLRTTPISAPRHAALTSGALLLGVGVSELTDGGGMHPRWVEVATAGVVLSALAWLLVATRRAAIAPAAMFMVGYLFDALATPSGTVFGPMVLALYLAVTHRSRALWSLVPLMAALSAMSLGDVAGLDVRMADGGGGPVRSAALGVVLIVAGGVAAWRRRGYSGTMLKSSKRAPEPSAETPL